MQPEPPSRSQHLGFSGYGSAREVAHSCDGRNICLRRFVNPVWYLASSDLEMAVVDEGIVEMAARESSLEAGD